MFSVLRTIRVTTLAACLFTITLIMLPGTAQADTQTENLLVVTIDGLRWQEVFGGIDKSLNNKMAGVENPRALREQFWRDTPEERREILMPFLWGTVVKDGKIFGDPNSGSPSLLTNPYLMSYPGYSEIFTGHVDLSIPGNVRRDNPNVSVFEWLNQESGFEGEIAAFASWNIFNHILPQERSGVYMNAGWEAEIEVADPAQKELLNELKNHTPHVWGTARFDVYTFYAAMEYLKANKPRILYVAFDESDDWGHTGRYDLYLDGAIRSDEYIQRLWDTMQSMPEYADKTTLIITTDHGRGSTLKNWQNHSSKTEGSENTWWAIVGPDTKHNGIVKNTPTSQNQLASTLAAILGKDYQAAVPEAGKPVPEALTTTR